MKKRLIFLCLLFLVTLSGCGLRERMLAPPEEYTVPDYSLVAECTKDDNHYKFVYKDDGVYQYFINDEEQGEDALDSLIEKAFQYGSSVENYLSAEFKDTCIITDYEIEEE